MAAAWYPILWVMHSVGRVPAQWYCYSIEGHLRHGSRRSRKEDPDEHPGEGRERAEEPGRRGAGVVEDKEALMEGNATVTRINKPPHWEWQWSAIIPGGQAGGRWAPNSGGERGVARGRGSDGKLMHQSYRSVGVSDIS
jgi:hypothetical protein